MASSLQDRISESTRMAVRSRERKQLAVLRLINAEIKQAQIASTDDLTDSDVLAVLNRMIKQRKSSAEQYEQANRNDLAQQEEYEIEVIETFTPQQLDDAEIMEQIDKACGELGASDMKQMGQIMRKLTETLAGRADMSRVSALVREKLTG